MKPPPGFGNLDKGKVFKLNKSLYGLKQAARVWNQALHEVLMNIGFCQSDADPCLYYVKYEGAVCFILVHADDIITASSSRSLIEKLMSQVKEKFEVSDLGDIKHYLGIEVEKNSDGAFCLSQTNYISNIVQEAGLRDAKPSKIPLDTGYFKLRDESLLESDNDYRKLIGMMLFVATHTRPDIAASVSILSQRISSSNKTDINEVKRVIRYLKGTSSVKLVLNRPDFAYQSPLTYSDANWAEDT